jgi:hypothetical protein
MNAKDSDRRPTRPDGTPIKLSHPGYYPGYSTLDQQAFWDAKTRKTVLKRVQMVPSVRFFTPEETRILAVICDHIIPQDDRDEAFRIPVLEKIDERLLKGRIDGYRYEDMPPEGEAFRLGIKAIDEIAQYMRGRPFIELKWLEQEHILKSLHDGKPPAAHEIWEKMPVHRFWMQLVQYCAEAYYAHPWAWDEIGFGGPAYPRAYMRLENGQPEPWEKDEQRYEWQAPACSVSDVCEPILTKEGKHASTRDR